MAKSSRSKSVKANAPKPIDKKVNVEGFQRLHNAFVHADTRNMLASAGGKCTKAPVQTKVEKDGSILVRYLDGDRCEYGPWLVAT